jgi:hypothetical protein
MGRLWLLWGTVALAAACKTTEPRPQEIRVGMTKAELVAAMGKPAETRGPTAGGSGRVEEVWLYRIEPEVASGGDVTKGVLSSGVGFFEDPTTGNRYRFVFIDERLANWGPAPAR